MQAGGPIDGDRQEAGTKPLSDLARPACSCPQGAGLSDRRAVPGPGKASGLERLHRRWRHGYEGTQGGSGHGTAAASDHLPSPTSRIPPTDMVAQAPELSRKPHVVIATPALADHLLQL